MTLDRAYQAMRAMVTRGRVALAAMNPKRTLVQLTGLKDETKTKIELLLPYGMSARPKGGDVIMLQVGGSRAHLVALCADDPALRIPELEEGEFGFRDQNGQQVVFRKDKLEVTLPLKMVMEIEGDLEMTVHGNVIQQVDGDVTSTVDGKAVVVCDDIRLGADGGGKKVALDGDPVVGGVVQASAAKVKAQ